MLDVAVTERLPAAHALRLLSTGCYSLSSFDEAVTAAEEECDDPIVAGQVAAARMRYRIHEQSLAGIIHGSEEYRAWAAERKQVFHEVRTALTKALAMTEA